LDVWTEDDTYPPPRRYEYAGGQHACQAATALVKLTSIRALSLSAQLNKTPFKVWDTTYDVWGYETPVARSAPWCASAAQLPQLQELSLKGMGLPHDELLRLTCLTALTGLCIEDDGLDDALAAGLITELQQLRKLRFASQSNMFSIVGWLAWEWPLPDLANLSLASTGQMPEDWELRHLTCFTSLTRLVLCDHCCSEQGLQDFLNCVPGLREVSAEWHSAW
jgi:hypothetical protein